MKKKAFTITELLVAVGLLAVVLTVCGIIFNYSIDSQRTAGATAEIMRNLRVITDQLNADFTGLIKMPAYVFSDPNTSENPPITADSIMFFATGDFQTANTYPKDKKNEPIRSNVARIYYGQADDPDLLQVGDEYGRKKILTRKQVLIVPDANTSTDEYDAVSLTDILKKTTPDPNWGQRPTINLNTDPNSIRMYLVSGVDNFRIAYCDAKPIGNINWQRLSPKENIDPLALKFSFTLYDSKGIIKTGRRFEHIVYIGK